jgi:hypothetical protein
MNASETQKGLLMLWIKHKALLMVSEDVEERLHPQQKRMGNVLGVIGVVYLLVSLC